uniref:NADH-ubiquinone oxidoreductase chain 6 n=1 Tax=Conocephalus differentus TaxID=948348 RepID=A0A343S7G2_9ORTH|nr:NADH dehydrogenase subunit 6 [Conocephalus differentus]
MALTTGLAFPLLNHPLLMALMIIIQAAIIIFVMSQITKTPWTSYITFLVFVGAMLILILYMTSLASNEGFIFPSFWMTIMMITMSSIYLIVCNMDQFFQLTVSEEIKPFTFNMITLHNESYNFLIKLYDTPTNKITLLLVSYLLLTLIIIVNVINMYMGPLRQIK